MRLVDRYYTLHTYFKMNWNAFVVNSTIKTKPKKQVIFAYGFYTIAHQQ